MQFFSNKTSIISSNLQLMQDLYNYYTVPYGTQLSYYIYLKRASLGGSDGK